MKNIKKDIMLRAYFVYVGILLFGLAILGKALYIQYFEGPALMEKAKKQEMRLFDVEAMRGNICSDDGTLLATSIPIFDVRMDVSSENISDDYFKENIDSLSLCLSHLFQDKRQSEYKKMLWEARRNGERYTLIQRHITYPELRQMRQFPIFRLGKYKGGLIVIPSYRREFPYKDLGARTIGYESVEDPGKVKVGLEGYYTQSLQGINGKRLERRIGNGAWMPVDVENQVEPQNGEDIITTLDINLQDLVESALKDQLIQDSANHGCAVVMEVKTGYIKAIANLGRTKQGTYEEVFNYAVGEATEPGSTFKLASFLVALEDNKINLNTPVSCAGGFVMYHGRKMSDSHSGLGTITAQQAFEKSSNVGTSKLIYATYANDPQKYIDGLYRLGIQKPLNLQIGGEARPYIKNTRSKWWSAVSLPWMSVGYEVALSPVQILTLYNAIANNGKMVKPLFVKEIRRNGEIVQSFSSQVINPAICSPSTLEKAKILLEGVVLRGTASLINNPIYKIAGKTGTAQLAQNNRGYNQDSKQVRYKGSFVGYFPADNPKYSIIVVIHDPRRGKFYGSQVAAPVFKEIADRIYASMITIDNPPKRDTASIFLPYADAGLQKDLTEVYSTLSIPFKPANPAAIWAKPLLANSEVVIEPEHIRQGTMPDVIGMGIKDALYILEQMGLRVRVTGKGTVIRQSIPPGQRVAKAEIVVLDLGTT
ncbi:MAG: penicillin-binding protein [Bacteroidota bacterium]|nr:penicillin-binding protein [Bacteroidota bacterium]